MRSHGHIGLEGYAQIAQAHNSSHMQFLNLANLQPMGEGETLYYAADVTPVAPPPSPLHYFHAGFPLLQGMLPTQVAQYPQGQGTIPNHPLNM